MPRDIKAEKKYLKQYAKNPAIAPLPKPLPSPPKSTADKLREMAKFLLEVADRLDNEIDPDV